MKNNEKINSIKIISHITEFINQTQIIQYYKNNIKINRKGKSQGKIYRYDNNWKSRCNIF